MAVRVEPSRKADANRLAALKRPESGWGRTRRQDQPAGASQHDEPGRGGGQARQTKTPGDGGDVSEHGAGNEKPDAQARPGQSRGIQGGQDQQGQDDLAMGAEKRERHGFPRRHEQQRGHAQHQANGEVGKHGDIAGHRPYPWWRNDRRWANRATGLAGAFHEPRRAGPEPPVTSSSRRSATSLPSGLPAVP